MKLVVGQVTSEGLVVLQVNEQPERMNLQEVESARSWLAELEWRNMDASDFDDLSHSEIHNAINQYFDGGVAEFLRIEREYNQTK